MYKNKYQFLRCFRGIINKMEFLNFEPGLVGGHCIGVDPYYLAEKAKSLIYVPEVILSGRNTNDKMVEFVGKEIVKKFF